MLPVAVMPCDRMETYRLSVVNTAFTLRNYVICAS